MIRELPGVRKTRKRHLRTRDGRKEKRRREVMYKVVENLPVIMLLTLVGVITLMEVISK